VVERLGIDPDRSVIVLDHIGNTSSASIPIALTEAVDAGRVASGDIVALCGFGAGMAWATQLWRWG
jgi:3-oxoacyl-[acyl-carrier-protein] synthase III